MTVAPTAVVLTGKRAEQRLLVTGEYAGGSTRDLTASARFTVDAPRVVAAAGHRLTPLADGKANVTVTVPGGPSVRVPVQVRNAAHDAPVSFQHEVIPALTRAGCNQGICHGTPTGKGGFRLSLQGYWPDFDLASLTREAGQRRTNPSAPAQSLLLRKALLQVPHRGGKRLDPGSPEYNVLARWIAEGAQPDPPRTPTLAHLELLPARRVLVRPASRQQIVALAHFSDGTTRDVTALSRFTSSNEELASVSRDGVVEGKARGEIAISCRYEHQSESVRLTFLEPVPGFAWSNPPRHNFVDDAVYAKLRQFNVPPSDLSTDAEFLRRAYLDAAGILPTPDEARAFLADPARDKREKLVDALLKRPEFADFWALKWADVLRVSEDSLTPPGVKSYHGWIRASIAANKPLDQFVRELLTATGSTAANPPVNFYRAVSGTDEWMETTSQVFLGVRMSCSRCHNNPFERWTQDEYFQMAAFFAQVRLADGTDKKAKEKTLELNANGHVTQPRTGERMAPKFLGGAIPKLPPGADPRTALAEWITGRENPFFARVMVNRIWYHVMGRGIVEPVDDFRDSNPPANEELVDALARDFVASGYDLRHVVRTIMTSRTYQLSARPKPLNRDDHRLFSHAVTKLLTAEQLLDAISSATNVPESFEGLPLGTRAAQVPGVRVKSPFMAVFGRPDRNLACECERSSEPTLQQALQLLTGRSLHQKLRAETSRISVLAASQKPAPEIIEEMYLATLTRLPTEPERAAATELLRTTPDRKAALEDLGWVLLNTKEFLFRH